MSSVHVTRANHKIGCWSIATRLHVKSVPKCKYALQRLALNCLQAFFPPPLRNYTFLRRGSDGRNRLAHHPSHASFVTYTCRTVYRIVCCPTREYMCISNARRNQVQTRSAAPNCKWRIRVLTAVFGHATRSLPRFTCFRFAEYVFRSGFPTNPTPTKRRTLITMITPRQRGTNVVRKRKRFRGALKPFACRTDCYHRCALLGFAQPTFLSPRP